MNGIITLGETLIDFTPLDNDNRDFRKNPGGAPANVAVALVRLGAKVSFIGKVGDDLFGKFLLNKLKEENVDITSTFSTKKARTAITFVSLDEKGDRSFEFYIDPSADRFLKPEEIKEKVFEDNKIFHFGSISLIDEPAQSATLKAIKLAKKNNNLVSYDPNLRLSLWNSVKEAKKIIVSVLDKCDILKVSKEELKFITEKSDIESGIKLIRNNYNIPYIFVTDGNKGSYSYHSKLEYTEAYKVETVDTTGAGDAFVAGILYNFNKVEKKRIDDEFIKKATQFANYLASQAVTHKGAMTSLPKLNE